MLKNMFAICHLVKQTGQVTLKGRDVLTLRAPISIFSLFVVQQDTDRAHAGVSVDAEEPSSFSRNKGALSTGVYLVQRSVSHESLWLFLCWDFSH